MTDTLTQSAHIVTLARREEALSSQMQYLAGAIASAVADECYGFTFDSMVEQYREARDEHAEVKSAYNRVLKGEN
ncbi:hypothetical protein [Brevibacterium zhoupengii]|uniref:hypothetical protein n=1 Tax=Brevibacterium zhoupengii TaxID=2898795 RepID=UPI001E3B7801|nr:hypothetical protein [Brevibacterium zhoupengii]